MARPTRGSIFTAGDGTTGIRWPEDGKRPQKTGFATKTDARRWFDENVAPRLGRRGPSAELTFEAFCELYLERHDGSERTVQTQRERLAPARKQFGSWPLRDLEGAADDVARWRSRLPTDSARFRHTRALRECLAAAVRWRYLQRNPAVDAGRNPEPLADELHPFKRTEVDALAAELGSVYGPLAIFAAETGLRTNEWAAIERRDIDRTGRRPAVVVQRRVSDGKVTPYPKTGRRRVPLTARALAAVEALPPRLDTKLLFPAPMGGYIGLDAWRTREWYPALAAAGIEQRGPYHLRHTFATEALAAGVSIFQLARVMGASVKTIDKHYGHLAHDAEDAILGLLDARALDVVPKDATASATDE
jgi:integrase